MSLPFQAYVQIDSQEWGFVKTSRGSLAPEVWVPVLLLEAAAGLLVCLPCAWRRRGFSRPLSCLPSLLSACPWVTYFYLKFCCLYPRKKTSVCTFSLPFLKLPTQQIPPIFPYSVTKDGQKRRCLKDFRFSERDKKGPLFLTSCNIFLKKLGCERVRVFLGFLFIACFSAVHSIMVYEDS